MAVTITRVRKWGNSLGLRLPKWAAAESQVREGTAVYLEVKEGAIVVRPTRKRRYKLAELLKQITKDNLHSEIDFGEPKGRELL